MTRPIYTIPMTHELYEQIATRIAATVKLRYERLAYSHDDAPRKIDAWAIAQYDRLDRDLRLGVRVIGRAD